MTSLLDSTSRSTGIGALTSSSAVLERDRDDLLDRLEEAVLSAETKYSV
jgi:hypothetical protein